MGEYKFKSAKTSATSDQPEETVCAGQALGFPLQASLGFLPIENLTLDVFRCVCDVYATASAQAWEFAVKFAEKQLGPVDGPLLVARVTAFLRALRKERRVGFSYLSPGCQHVSPDELTVTGLLKAARNGDRSALERGLALTLDNAEATDSTRIAVQWLAEAQLPHVPPTEHDSAQSEFDKQTVQAIYLH
jgi:hypothetical protein